MSNLVLPTGFINDISTNASTFLTSLSPYLTMIMGVLLAALVIGMIISAIKH